MSAPDHLVLPPDTDPQVAEGLGRVLAREPSVGAVGLGTATLEDVLAVPAGPYAVRRSALAEVGDVPSLFDAHPALGRLDLGWRLRARGWRVCTAVSGEAAGGGDPESPDAEPPDAEGAALRLAVLHRNLDDAVFHALLPPALAATRRLAGIGAAASARYEELAPLLGRAAVQAGRTRGHLELLPYVRTEPGVLPPGTRELAGPEGERLLAGRQRVLVLTLDTVGPRMAGPAIRAWELAHALAGEHDVTLVARWDGTATSPRLRLLDLDDPNLRYAAARSDIVIVQGWALHDHPWLADLPVVLVADLYDAIHLETLEVERELPLPERRRSVRVATEVLMAQVRRGDFFLCASTRQRDLWLGHLAAAGRLNPDTYDGDESLRRLIAQVPFGVSQAPLAEGPGAIKGVVPGIAADDEVVLWGGGIYNWFDPLTVIRAVARVHEQRPQVRLFFLGTRHPNPGVPEMAMAAAAVELAEQLGLAGSVVFFNDGWVPYEERSRWLADADVGISCHFEHLETAYSFRTRMLDYLWAGLPIVCSDGDVFADLVRTRGLGRVVAPQDVDGLADALLSLLGDPAEMATCRKQVTHVAEEMRWDRLAVPLLEFCRRPRPAPDRLLPPPPRRTLEQRVRSRLRRLR